MKIDEEKRGVTLYHADFGQPGRMKANVALTILDLSDTHYHITMPIDHFLLIYKIYSYTSNFINGIIGLTK